MLLMKATILASAIFFLVLGFVLLVGVVKSVVRDDKVQIKALLVVALLLAIGSGLFIYQKGVEVWQKILS